MVHYKVDATPKILQNYFLLEFQHAILAAVEVAAAVAISVAHDVNKAQCAVAVIAEVIEIVHIKMKAKQPVFLHLVF